MNSKTSSDIISRTICSDDLARAIVTIVSVDGQSAYVESCGNVACRSCAGPNGCGTKSLMEIFGKRNLVLRVDNKFGAAVGDQIEIGIEHSTILRLSALSYLFPLLGLLGGGAIGEFAGATDLVSLGTGVAGLIASFAYSRHLYRSGKWGQDIAPICLRQLSAGNEKFIDIDSGA